MIGQTCAQMAAQISFLAIPLVATIALDATPGEMAFLTALGGVPSLVIGLHAGVMADRYRRRRLMIAADVGRVLLLGVVPLAYLLDSLTLPLLAIVVVLAGMLTLLFDVSYQALLANILDRRNVVTGNSALELSRTAAELTGPGIAGQLVQWFGAPLALVSNAALYAVSALAIWRIDPARDHQPVRHSGHPSFRQEIVEGFRAIWSIPPLRVTIIGRGMLVASNAALEVVFILYVVRVLHVGPALLGLIFGVGGVGFLIGALVPRLIAGRIGFGVSTAIATAVIALSDLLVPFAETRPAAVVPLLILAQLLFGVGMTVFNVNQASLRQLTIPTHIQGRASATARFIADASVPLGAAMGGLLGETIGLRSTLVVAAAAELLVACWFLASPLRDLRSLPVPQEA
jgi:predicted MFS family arabinose efflux permease